MNNTKPINLNKLMIGITIVIFILTFGWLIWSYFHGGVPSHHILDQKNLPAISNWWSGILLPLLTWILLGKIKVRIEKQTKTDREYKLNIAGILMRFIVGLAFGILLSVSFIHNYKPFLDNVIYLLLLLSLIIPIFFSEFILGFVIGMTYTFGAILPTAFMAIMGAIGFLTYRFIRPLFLKFAKKNDD